MPSSPSNAAPPDLGGISRPPVLDVDPYSDDVLANPYACYQAIRDAGPVVWFDRYDTFGVARHDDVKFVLDQPEIFCSSAGVGLANFKKEVSWRPPSLILEADPPEHGPRRRVLARILSPVALKQLRGEFERQAIAFIDRIVDMGDCDGVKDLALAYPLKVFGDAVGLPAEGREHLLPYGDLVFNGFGPMNDRFERRIAQSADTVAWITAICQRDALRPDGFGAQIYAAADAGEIAHHEAPLLVRTLVSAGLDTTIFTLSNAIVCLSRHPDQWMLLRDNPSIARRALEEVMRFESTFQSFYRTTTRRVRVAGVEIPENQKVWVGIAAANRDPRKWASPDRFDVTRNASGNMSFGTGIHGCVGQMIARLEGEIVLKALAERVAELCPTGNPVVHFNNTVRGYSSMPLSATGKSH